MQDANNWIIEETKSVNLGDKRLNKRYRQLLNSLTSAPSASIPRACKSWAETIAAYRFFNHENTSFNNILSPHQNTTLKRIQEEKIVLILQDTTKIDFTGRKPIAGMGFLNTHESHGFYLHPSIAITPEKLCLGVIDFQMWARESLGKRADRKNKRIEDKESFCWLKGYEAANTVALNAPGATIISISDREGDIYEMLEKTPSETNKAYWLIRSSRSRGLLNEIGEKQKLGLWETVNKAKPIGKIEFKLAAGKIYQRSMATQRQARKERVVQQEIRACTVNLRPTQRKGKKLSAVTINVIHCKEINAPSNEEKIEWFLLTSFPIHNAETVIEIVRWYLCRWEIELFFKILKSGCTVEELQFDTLQATSKCIALYSIVAWRILYLTMLGRCCPEIECSVIFESNEWQAVYSIVTKKPPPKHPPMLNEIILMIAKLGGFLGRKSDKHPGTKVMWIGMQRMRDFALAWEIFNSVGNKSYV